MLDTHVPARQIDSHAPSLRAGLLHLWIHCVKANLSISISLSACLLNLQENGRQLSDRKRLGWKHVLPTCLRCVKPSACCSRIPFFVQIRAPNEFQGAIIGDVNRRKGLIQNSEGEGDEVVIEAHVPLAEMFGYSTGLRSMTQGKGEFTMEYNQHAPVTADKLAELTLSHKRGS